MYAKCITLDLKLDQWNKVALKQKEVLALYLSLLSPSGLFLSWYFYQPSFDQELLQQFIIKCDTFFNFPQTCFVLFSSFLYTVLEKTNK